MADQTWTRLAERYAKRQLSVRLCFGEPAQSRQAGGAPHHWFGPGRLVGVRWWARLSPRRQVAGFAVVGTLAAGKSGYRLPFVRPAVAVHLFACGRCVGDDRGVAGRAERMVRRMRQLDVDPCRVPPAYWRLAGQALRVGRTPRPLTSREIERYRTRPTP